MFGSCCLNHKTRLYLVFFFSFNSHYFFLRPNPFLYEVVCYLLLSLRNPVITNRFVLKWELITPADLQRKQTSPVVSRMIYSMKKNGGKSVDMVEILEAKKKTINLSELQQKNKKQNKNRIKILISKRNSILKSEMTFERSNKKLHFFFSVIISNLYYYCNVDIKEWNIILASAKRLKKNRNVFEVCSVIFPFDSN